MDTVPALGCTPVFLTLVFPARPLQLLQQLPCHLSGRGQGGRGHRSPRLLPGVWTPSLQQARRHTTGRLHAACTCLAPTYYHQTHALCALKRMPIPWLFLNASCGRYRGQCCCHLVVYSGAHHVWSMRSTNHASMRLPMHPCPCPCTHAPAHASMRPMRCRYPTSGCSGGTGWCWMQQSVT